MHENIEFTKQEIVEIIARACQSSYGVVGMASKEKIKDEMFELLNIDNSGKGLEINFDYEGNVSLDVYVVLQYGVKIPEVVKSLQDVIKYTVKKKFNIEVVVFNIYVQGLKIIGDKNE